MKVELKIITFQRLKHSTIYIYKIRRISVILKYTSILFYTTSIIVLYAPRVL